MTCSIRHLALAGATLLGLTGFAQAATLVGLTVEGQVVRIDSETRRATSPVRIQGASGRLLGIDVRPADSKLYGVTESGEIVTIDPVSGKAMKVSQLSERFESGGRAVVDFNPVADRLRLMGMGGMNFRVNVETGQVARDGELKYQQGTPLGGTMPRITAGAYTNSMKGATATMLLTIDGVLSQMNLQTPPDDGIQQVRGTIGHSVSSNAAFDILSEGTTNTAYLLSGGVLHTVNLENGTLSVIGPVAGSVGNCCDALASFSATTPIFLQSLAPASSNLPRPSFVTT